MNSPGFVLSHLVGMAMVQVWCMRMVMRQNLVLVWVGMGAVYQWRTCQMRVVMVFIRVCMGVDVFSRFVNMMVVMVLAQHQPGTNRHYGHGEPEQSLGHFLQQHNGK